MGTKDKQIRQGQEFLNIIRIGEIVSTNPANATARVKIEDADGMPSNPLRITYKCSLKNKEYLMPEIGEQVVCLFLPNGLEEGVILGCLYNAKDIPPINKQGVDHITYSDGTVIEYDTNTHKLMANVKGDAEIISSARVDITAAVSITLTAPIIYLNGNVSGTSPGNVDFNAGTFSVNADQVNINEEC